MSKSGIGIIGCGNISAAYLRLAPQFASLEIRAVADLDNNAARYRADEFGVRAESVAELLQADDIDIILNLTPPAAHYAVTHRILSDGKHAYSEKPLVLTLEQGQKLRKLSQANKLRVGAAPDTFLGGAHQQARAIIDQGGIGRITSGTAHVMSHGMEHWHPNPDFFYQAGAGPMLDVGPYYVTNLIQLLGPVVRVAALSSAADDVRAITSEPRNGDIITVNTPTNIHALLEFEQGATITLTTSWDVWAHRHAPMELYGTDGSLFVPDPNFFAGELGQADKSGEVSQIAPWEHAFSVLNQEDDDQGMVANYRGAGLADLVGAIDSDRPHRCSLDLALHAVDVMTSILRSGETGEFVSLATTCDRPAALSPAEASALLSG